MPYDTSNNNNNYYIASSFLYESHFLVAIGYCNCVRYHESLSCNNNIVTIYHYRRELYTKPRTLKQICRVVIYNSLGRKAAPLVPKLPLPTRLKDYIINLET